MYVYKMYKCVCMYGSICIQINKTSKYTKTSLHIYIDIIHTCIHFTRIFLKLGRLALLEADCGRVTLEMVLQIPQLGRCGRHGLRQGSYVAS